MEAKIGGKWIKVNPIFIGSQEDVALLELPQEARAGFVPINLRTTEPQMGEPIAVLGFPQFGPGYGNVFFLFRIF